MIILARKALIIDPQSLHHNSVKDILIESGRIVRIGDDIIADAEHVIQGDEIIITPGFIDLFSNFCDPGNEHKETLETGAETASAGGYTKVCVIPNTKPVIDTKTQAEYIIQKSRGLPVTVLPIGAISKNCDGKELAEMYDMRNSGCIAFSDGTHPVQSAGLLVKALQYVNAFNGVIIQVPDDKSMSKHGLMNEGIISTRLGLPGIPALAEELMIKRDIDLVKYTNSRIHFTGISTANSVALIKQAKSEGLNVTCSVTPYHLIFSEEDLASYDTNLKVSPPLRTKNDVAVLQDAVLNGDIDCVASHHFPQHWDDKVCEFEYAKNGMLGIQSAFCVVNTALPGISNELLAKLFTLNAANILGIEKATIKENEVAELTVFSRKQNYTFTSENNRSRSINTPVTGMQLRGKVIATINKGKVFLNN